jgi:hypothetical protein
VADHANRVLFLPIALSFRRRPVLAFDATSIATSIAQALLKHCSSIAQALLVDAIPQPQSHSEFRVTFRIQSHIQNYCSLRGSLATFGGVQ